MNGKYFSQAIPTARENIRGRRGSIRMSGILATFALDDRFTRLRCRKTARAAAHTIDRPIARNLSRR
jgi:hypothetical protein